ncbi:hypothetical protein ACXZ65_33930 [Streptomyces aculeolatus]
MIPAAALAVVHAAVADGRRDDLTDADAAELVVAELTAAGWTLAPAPAEQSAA